MTTDGESINAKIRQVWKEKWRPIIYLFWLSSDQSL